MSRIVLVQSTKRGKKPKTLRETDVDAAHGITFKTEIRTTKKGKMKATKVKVALDGPMSAINPSKVAGTSNPPSGFIQNIPLDDFPTDLSDMPVDNPPDMRSRAQKVSTPSILQ
jgi:hypothetical protein